MVVVAVPTRTRTASFQRMCSDYEAAKTDKVARDVAVATRHPDRDLPKVRRAPGREGIGSESRIVRQRLYTRREPQRHGLRRGSRSMRATRTGVAM
jgi:hypothetical protein